MNTILPRKSNQQPFSLALLAGLAGAIFPLCGWIIDSAYRGLSFNSESIVALHQQNPVHFLVDSAPFVLFALAYVFSGMVWKQREIMQQAFEAREKEIRKLSDFAQKIGQNDLSQGIENVNGEENMLARALEDMRQRLRSTQKREKNDRWLTQGRLEIDRLLKENKEDGDMLFLALEKLVGYVGAVQGAIYTIEDTREDPKPILRREATYAYQRRKFIQDQLHVGEGLIGEAAVDQQVIHRTEVPDDFVTLNSGLLGDQKPGAILILPMVADQRTEGVIELAAFTRFDQMSIELLEESAAMLARSITERRQRAQTEALLEQSREMTSKLQAQQKDLQHTAQQMSAKQTELSQAKQALEQQVHEVQNQQQRERAILENASEIIAIFDATGNMKYISPSVRFILGYQPSQFVGLRNFADALEDGFTQIADQFSYVQEHPEEDALVEFQYPDAYGKALWIEATITNQLDNPAIEGVVFNMRNITSRKQAEQEQEMRARMESLSENSSNIILRLDMGGELLYLNPAVEQSFGIDRRVWIQHNLADTPLKADSQHFLTDLMGRVEESMEKIAVETRLQMRDGQRELAADGIPEFNEEGQLETMLVVMRDITDSKQQLAALQVANQKVSDSINYARRIQDAIIPEAELLHQWFRGAMMLNRPRDVVSGDFPWMAQRQQYIYVAAADCTGHGVPGAIMSAIGNLLLRDILRQQQTPTPSEMLMCLHQGVVEVLQQESDNKNANDGLDIGLMRLDLDNKQLLFSGAHRPLFYLTAGGNEVERLRGDRFSIGGTHGRGRTKFTDQHLSLQRGDRFYLFSDGLTDQFNAQKVKFGPKRVREMILENRDLSMARQSEIMASRLDTWMEGVAQLDDILLVGIEV